MLIEIVQKHFSNIFILVFKKEKKKGCKKLDIGLLLVPIDTIFNVFINL